MLRQLRARAAGSQVTAGVSRFAGTAEPHVADCPVRINRALVLAIAERTR
jgi:hypothetical protein